MKQKKKKSLKRDIIEIVVALFAAFIFYTILSAATGTSMPLVSVVSDSMEPVLQRGDLLFVTSTDEYQARDIVIYQNQHVPYTIVHRIISKQTEEDGSLSFIIKGDNNQSPDPFPVKENEIKGKVQLAIPLLGYPRLALMAIGI
tara:strand:+ start:969 stop:1400 length:432 start_codon:yes stop_codon:yes gene_type:complete